MSIQSFKTLQVPEGLFARLQRVAKQTHRSVEDILVTSVNAILPPEPTLPDVLASELAAMMLYKDEQLWAATESSLSSAQQCRLQQLTGISDQRTLSAAEEAELQTLLDEYDRALLRRGRAFVILAQRGYELPDQTELVSNGEIV